MRGMPVPVAPDARAGASGPRFLQEIATWSSVARAGVGKGVLEAGAGEGTRLAVGKSTGLMRVLWVLPA